MEKQHQHHMVQNYWQMYFGISGFFISVVSKMKWKAYAEIIIITNDRIENKNKEIIISSQNSNNHK